MLHWVCNNAGCSKKEIADARGPSQTLYWQIYALNDLAVTAQEIKQAISLGYRGFALTVDAIRAGKRERDVRVGLEEDKVSPASTRPNRRLYPADNDTLEHGS